MIDLTNPAMAAALAIGLTFLFYGVDKIIETAASFGQNQRLVRWLRAVLGGFFFIGGIVALHYSGLF